MEELEGLKPNSHKSKEIEKRKQKKEPVAKVISGKAKIKKKSELSKIADIFIAEDIDNVKAYILEDVVIPSIKKTIEDVVNNSIRMLFWNGSAPKSSGNKVSYSSYSKQYERGDRFSREAKSSSYSRMRRGYSYSDVIVDTRAEADDVLNRMDEIVQTYGCVSVADLFDLVGADAEYTDNKYGWMDISAAYPQRVRDGWMIKLPKPLPFD